MSSVKSELNPLGKKSAYIDQYDASILFDIDRNESWQEIGKERLAVPFYGVDIWNAYEVSWLNLKGKPVVCLAEFHVPANSPYLIESKSFKLYLNSFNQTRCASADAVKQLMQQDLSKVAGAEVKVIFHSIEASFAGAPKAHCIDAIDIEITQYQPDASLLALAEGDAHFDGWLVSHLLKSNCPVTGQPDWGSVYIYYRGQKIAEESLLAYIVSLRQHQGFHEMCCEQIFQDLTLCGQPEKLIVYTRYVRRGGLDINPFRSSEPEQAMNFMLIRQ